MRIVVGSKLVDDPIVIDESLLSVVGLTLHLSFLIRVVMTSHESNHTQLWHHY